MTLLEMYEQFHNGNKKSFYEAVEEYGLTDFLLDAIEECKNGVLSFDELYAMKRTIKTLKESL